MPRRSRRPRDGMVGHRRSRNTHVVVPCCNDVRGVDRLSKTRPRYAPYGLVQSRLALGGRVGAHRRSRFTQLGGKGEPVGQPYYRIGFVIIVILYLVIGLMAAAGTVFMVRRVLAKKAEQIFYGMFLILIAAFYLAFTAYFGATQAWPVETAAVVVFVAIGLLGSRLPFALIVGY